MTGMQLVSARERKGWTQEEAASKLGMSQSYLSHLEKGKRPVTSALARQMAQLYGLSPVVLPLKPSPDNVPPTNDDNLAEDLATLGNPGFSHVKKSSSKRNPAEVLASALQAS